LHRDFLRLSKSSRIIELDRRFEIDVVVILFVIHRMPPFLKGYKKMAWWLTPSSTDLYFDFLRCSESIICTEFNCRFQIDVVFVFLVIHAMPPFLKVDRTKLCLSHTPKYR